MPVLTDQDIAQYDTKNQAQAPKVLTDSDIANFDSQSPNASTKQPDVPGKINMSGEESHGQFQGLKDVGNLIMNPAGTVSKALTGKTIAQNIAGDQSPIPKDAPFTDVLAKNARAGLGDVVENAANLGAYGAGAKIAEGIGGIGEAISNAKNSIATKALSPEFSQDAGDIKYGHDARRVIQSMPDVIGEDAPSTKLAIVNKTQETGQAIGDTIANSPKSNLPIGLTDNDVVGHIDDKIADLNKADPIGNKRTVRALEAKKVALLNNFDAKGNVTSPVDFDNMTPQQAFDYKEQKLGDIKYTGRQGVDETALNSSLKESRGNITAKMNDALPELKPLNQDYGDLKSAQDGIDKVIAKGQREGLDSLGIKNIITAGLNNPINRAKLAQFLYTAPKSEIASLQQQVPNLATLIKQNFQSSPQPSFQLPKLGLAGKVGNGKTIVETPFNPTKNIEGFNPNDIGKQSAEPIVTNRPANTTRTIGGPESNMESEGSPAIQYSGPNPKGERTDINNLRRNNVPTPQKEDSLSYPSKLGIGLATAGSIGALAKNANAKQPIKDEDAIKTIIGEGESTGFQGMRALASAIRNRGTLQGAYGINSPRVVNKLYSPKTYRLAKQAWEDSLKKDYSNGANHWFSDADLKKQNVKNMVKGMQKLGYYRGNTFYKESK